MDDDLKAKLLASRGLGTRHVEVDGVGKVEVRGLTRAEALRIQSADLDAAQMECELLATAMVTPALTVDEVAKWQAVAPVGELEPISSAIQELSGMKVKAVAEQMRHFRG